MISLYIHATSPWSRIGNIPLVKTHLGITARAAKQRSRVVALTDTMRIPIDIP